jgi:DNA-binding MarR family transcriptional regulator
MTRKLDSISSAIPEMVEHSFRSFKSIFDNISEYVELLIESIELLGAGQADKKGAFLADKSELPLDYIRFCLNQLERRRQLVRSLSSDALTWWLIFTIAEAQFSEQELFVSDLYVSAPSAKTTINSRINMLIDEGVVEKKYHPDDGRRQHITLKSSFEEVLIDNIQTSLGMIKRIVTD